MNHRNQDNITQLSPLVPIALMDYPIELELTSYIRTPKNIIASYAYTEELKDRIMALESGELYPFNRVRWVRDSRSGIPVRIQFIKDSEGTKGNRMKAIILDNLAGNYGQPHTVYPRIL